MKSCTSAILHGSHEHLHLSFMKGPWCPSGFIPVHESLNCIVQTPEVHALALLQFPTAGTLQVRLLTKESIKVSLTSSDVSGRPIGWGKMLFVWIFKNFYQSKTKKRNALNLFCCYGISFYKHPIFFSKSDPFCSIAC